MDEEVNALNTSCVRPLYASSFTGLPAFLQNHVTYCPISRLRAGHNNALTAFNNTSILYRSRFVGCELANRQNGIRTLNPVLTVCCGLEKKAQQNRQY